MEIDYADEYDILYIGREGAGYRVQVDNFILEFSMDGDVAAVEMMYAVDTLTEHMEGEVKAEDLRNLEDAEMETEERNSTLYVTLTLIFTREGEVVEKEARLEFPTEAADV